MIAVYMNAAHTIGNLIDGNHVVVVEAGQPAWAAFVALHPTPYVAPPPVIEVVPDLTFAQLMIGLVEQGWITEAEGNGWLIGLLPVSVVAVINSLPVEQRFEARARATRPTVIMRSEPLVNLLALSQGKSPAEIDNFFRYYATK